MKLQEKKRNQVLAAGLMVGLLASGLAAQDRGRPLVFPLDDPTRPATLEVSLVSGSIRVEGYDGTDVILEMSAADGSDEVTEVDGMFRIPNNTVGLSATQQDNHIEIDAEWGDRIQTLVIRAPRSTSAHLSTVNDGDITVVGLSGAHELDNVNGEIEATDISGSLVANTTNGDVLVRFLSVEADTPMSFSTWNGDVDITFPAGLAADLRIKSHQGDILSDFPVDLDVKSPQVRREDTGRGSRIEIESEVRGRIGGGGPEYRFETFNGDVLIRSGG